MHLSTQGHGSGHGRLGRKLWLGSLGVQFGGRGQGVSRWVGRIPLGRGWVGSEGVARLL